MKTILISSIMLIILSAQASEAYKIAITTCLDAKNEEAIVTKQRIVHIGENRDSYFIQRTGQPSTHLYASWIGETLKVKETSAQMMIEGMQKHVLDTRGNVTIPDNLYRADIRTFKLDRINRTATLEKKWVERTLFRTHIKERTFEKFHSCVENIHSPSLNF